MGGGKDKKYVNASNFKNILNTKHTNQKQNQQTLLQNQQKSLRNK